MHKLCFVFKKLKFKMLGNDFDDDLLYYKVQTPNFKPKIGKLSLTLEM